MDPRTDSQGNLRGQCTVCNCTGFRVTNVKNQCANCPCKPIRHQILSDSPQTGGVIPPSTIPPLAPPIPPPYPVLPVPSGIRSPGSVPHHANGKCGFGSCSRDRAVENGRIHDFCSRIHAELHLNNQTAPVCQLNGCGKEAFFDEKGQYYNYCGRSHAAQAREQPAVAAPTCQLPGCQKTCFYSEGRYFSFCGISHKNLALVSTPPSPPPLPIVGKCLSPVCITKRVDDSAYCTRVCMEAHSRNDPHLHFLPPNSSKYRDVAEQFANKWLHKTAKGQVVSVLVIYATSSLTKRFNDYVSSIVQNRPDLRVHGNGGPGNVHRRFHGTNAMKCTLGLNGNSTLCQDTGCATCGIIRSGLLISRAQTNHNWGRYGRGLYLSSVSSKSNDYNSGTSAALGGNHRAMFVCKVAIGRGHRTLTDMLTIQDAPTGYDSVLGEVGGTLNYDEVVVYREGAILPLYLIIYKV